MSKELPNYEKVELILDYCDFGDPNVNPGIHVDPVALREYRINKIHDYIIKYFLIRSDVSTIEFKDTTKDYPN